MANLDESLIKALQSIDADKAISDKFKSCSKENVYDMLKERGYKGSTQEFENLLSNIEKEIGDLLMQKKSDKDLSNVSGGKGANYFRKGLALGLTALSVGSTVQPGAFAAEVKQNVNTKSFGEKAKEFFSKAKGKVSNFVDAHPGATLLVLLGVTNVVNTFVTWGLTKHHYNKTQTEIKQEISGARVQLLATCKDIIGVESGKYEEKLKAFEDAVDNKVKDFKFDENLTIDDIKVEAVNEFKALFGDVNNGKNVFNALLTVDGQDGKDLDVYINGIRAEIAKRLQNDSKSKFAGLKTEQLNFLSTVIGYAENVVMLKQAERIEKVTSEVTGAKQTITNNLDSIQGIISKGNEEAFTDDAGGWRANGNGEQAKKYKAVVTKVREGFENVLKSVFGSLEKANEVDAIKTTMTALTFFEENIINNENKLVNLKGDISGVSGGQTKSKEAADKDTVNALANAEDLKAFVNVILDKLRKVKVGADANGSVAKFKVVEGQQNFLSSDEKAELERKAILIEKIANLMTINGLEKYENETKEFESLDVAKEAFIGSEFVKTVDEWVAELKKNQGEDKIFADTKLNSIKNLSERVNAIGGKGVGDLAAEIDKAFNGLIDEVKNLFNSNKNFNKDYKDVGVYDKVAEKEQGIFADKYVDKFKLAGKKVFNEKKKEEKTFKVSNDGRKKLCKDKNSLADSLENVEIGSSQLKLKKDNDNSNGLNGKFGGNVDNLKTLLCAMVDDVLYKKLEDAFNGFDDLKGVEISKDELDKKGKDDFSYKFFAKLNEVEDNDDGEIKAFKTWIKDAAGVELQDGTGVSKSIWDLITEAAKQE